MAQPDSADVHIEGVVMPIGPYTDFATCVADQREKGHNTAEARRICGAMERDMTKTDLRILEKRQGPQRFTLGVVYEPDVKDTQGEFAKAADIESAAWAFMERLQRLAKSGAVILKSAIDADADEGITLDVTEIADLVEKGVGLDDEHLQIGDEEDLGVIVESYLAPDAMEIGGQKVRKGAWLLGVKWSQVMWDKIKAGERTGLSLYGLVDREEVA